MAWETNETNQQTKVLAKNQGDVKEFTFDGNTPLKEAVNKVAQDMGYSSCLVQCDGRTVEPNEGDTPINKFQTVEVLPKYSGAC